MLKSLFISFYSPIHIGTGEELEPFEYVIDDNNMLYTFSFFGFVESLSVPDREKLLELQSGPAESSFKNIRNFVKHRFDKKDIQCQIPVSPQVGQIYREKFGKIESMLKVDPFIKTMDTPYLPGSSLKGALRTAVLNLWANSVDEKGHRCRNEGDILNTTVVRNNRERTDISLDVFKYLKIPDIPIGKDFTWFTRISNFNIKDGYLNETGIPMLKEVSCSRVCQYTGFQPGAREFEVKLKIDEEIMRHKRAVTGRRDLTFDTLWQSLDFYRRILKREKEKWSPYHENLKQFYENFYNFLDESGKKYDIKVIKLGFGSGFEAVTIERIRDPGKKYGKSVNLVEEKYPLGWAVLRSANSTENGDT
jgi:CRISPR-associated protein Csm5